MAILSLLEVTHLASGFAETCRFIESLRLRNPQARHIQYPKIPESLSESITVHSMKKGIVLKDFGPFSNIRLGRKRKGKKGCKEADIIATTVGGRVLNIEVKASGKNDFATFGKDDYQADVLLWLRFDQSLFRNELGDIQILVCPKPIDNLPWDPGEKQRVNARQLIRDWKGDPKKSLQQSMSLHSLISVGA